MVISAVKEVGGPSFFALLVIAVSFMPIFALEAQEGRLFKPLAFTKNFSMIIAAVLAITLDPAIRLLFTHMKNFSFRPRFLARVANAVLVGKIHSEENHPISRPLMRIYHPIVEFVLRHQWSTIVAAFLVVAVTFAPRIGVFEKIGSEFMPPLDEGTLLYMPITRPGHFRHRSAAGAPDPGQDPEILSGSRTRVRQGRAGRNGHRPCAFIHDGDGDRSQAAVRVAENSDLVFGLGARVAQGHPAQGMARPPEHPRPDLRAQRPG